MVPVVPWAAFLFTPQVNYFLYIYKNQLHCIGVDLLSFTPFTQKLEKGAYFPSNCYFHVTIYIVMHPCGDYDKPLTD